MKISTKLAVLFSIIFIVVGLVPFYFFYTASLDRLEKSVTAQLQSVAVDSMKTIDQMFYERYLDIRMLAADPVIASTHSTPRQITDRLLAYKRAHPTYLSLSFFDLNRTRIADTAGIDLGVQHSYNEYWPEIASGKAFVTNLSVSESLKTAVVHFVALVKDSAGRPSGVVVSRIPLESVNAILEDHIMEYHMGNEATMELVDGGGRIIFSSNDKTDMFKNISHEWGAVKEFIVKGANSGEYKVSSEKEFNIFARERGHLDFKGNNWVLIIEMPEQVALASLMELKSRFGLTLLAIMVLISPPVFLLSRVITKPIYKLRNALTEIGKGNLDIKIDVENADEMGELATSFNRMVANLREANDARKKAEKDSSDSNEQYRSLVNNIPDVVWTTGKDGNTTFISPNIKKILGYSPDEVYADPSLWLGHIHPEDRQNVEDAFGELFTGTRVFHIEYRIRRKDGEWIWLYDRALATYEKDGKWYADGIFTDITERKIAEEKLLNSRASLRAIMDNSPYMMWLKDLDGRYLAANMEFLKTTNRTQMSEVIGKTDLDLWPQPLADKFRADDFKVMATRQQKLSEESTLNGDGKMSWVETFKTPVVDKNGHLLGTTGFARDTTEHRKMEQELKRDARQVEALLKINEVGGTLPENEFLCFCLGNAEQLTGSQIAFILFVDADQKAIEQVIWSNATMEKHCQMNDDNNPYPVEQAGIWADCLHRKQAVIFNDYAGYEAKRGPPEDHSGLQRLIGVPVIEEGRVRIILGLGNKETGYDEDDLKIAQLIGNDLWRIARRQRTEAELKTNLEQQRLLNKKLEEAQSYLLQSEKMASLGQLAAGVAHELNNPLGFVNSNLGSLENYLHDIFAVNAAYEDIENTACDSNPAFEKVHTLKQQKDYDFIRQDTFQLMAESKDGLSRMRKIVQDLKSFSRIGEEEWQWADLHQGLDSTLNIVWNELKYKCQVNKEYGELPEVYCMPPQLNQVFMNLLVNAGQAIKEKGTITIRTGVQDKEVWVEVEDTGTGIPPDLVKRIFDPFFTTKPVGQGTGLGLSLSYGIVQKHGGRIEVNSTEGKGTIMRMWLPIKPPLHQPETPATGKATVTG